MRRAVLVAAVVLASSVALAPFREAADDAKPLLGRWESVTRSAGGLGQIMELRADGKLLVKGEDVLVKARGTQRIKAGSVNIN